MYLLSFSCSSCPYTCLFCVLHVLLLLVPPSCWCPLLGNVLVLLMSLSTSSWWVLPCCRASFTRRAHSPRVLVVLVCLSSSCACRPRVLVVLVCLSSSCACRPRVLIVMVCLSCLLSSGSSLFERERDTRASNSGSDAGTCLTLRERCPSFLLSPVLSSFLLPGRVPRTCET